MPLWNSVKTLAHELFGDLMARVALSTEPQIAPVPAKTRAKVPINSADIFSSALTTAQFRRVGLQNLFKFLCVCLGFFRFGQ